MDFMSIFLIKFDSMCILNCGTVTRGNGTALTVLILGVFPTCLMTVFRGAGMRVPGIMAVLLMVPAIGIPGGIPGGITGGITARADAPVSVAAISLSGPSQGESTYLSLTRERMRHQLAAGDLEAAARTLQWIRKIQLDGTVNGTNITYFDGDTGQFTYSTELTYSDIQSGTNSVFEATSSTRSDAGFSMKNSNTDSVHFEVTDEIGFMIDSGTGKAAVINSTINPILANPTGYNDATRQMIQPAWRVLEPQ